MQEKKPQNVDFILKNVKSLIEARNDSDLAEFFGVKTGTVSAWRSRNSIDWALLIAKCSEMGWNLDEIIYGSTTTRSYPAIHRSNVTQPRQTPEKREYQERRILEDKDNILIELILAKDDEVKKLSEEIGALKEQIRVLRKKAGYDTGNQAAEPD